MQLQTGKQCEHQWVELRCGSSQTPWKTVYIPPHCRVVFGGLNLHSNLGAGYGQNDCDMASLSRRKGVAHGSAADLVLAMTIALLKHSRILSPRPVLPGTGAGSGTALLGAGPSPARLVHVATISPCHATQSKLVASGRQHMERAKMSRGSGLCNLVMASALQGRRSLRTAPLDDETSCEPNARSSLQNAEWPAATMSPDPGVSAQPRQPTCKPAGSNRDLGHSPGPP